MLLGSVAEYSVVDFVSKCSSLLSDTILGKLTSVLAIFKTIDQWFTKWN